MARTAIIGIFLFFIVITAVILYCALIDDSAEEDNTHTMF